MSTSNTKTASSRSPKSPEYLREGDCGLVPVECDILIIGAGAAGLITAATIREEGCRVLLVEKNDYVGGTTFRSGGCMWMPDNPRMQEQGIEDSREKAECYIRAVREAKVEAQDPDPVQEQLWNRWLQVYLTEGPQMMDYLRGEGFQWMTSPSSLPDYHAHRGAGTRGGVVTNEFARVLDRRQEPIECLFAGGSTSVSRLETEGVGTTIGPAMTEGFVAATLIQSAANIA
ncbi:hypothetical protein ACHAO7_010074 [Fusarium culmorum]